MAEEIKLNLVQKLAKIREMVEVLRKNKSGFNYKYVTEDEILARVAAGMKKYNVSLKPCVVPGTLTTGAIQYQKTKKSKTGDPIVEDIHETLVQADLVFTWINCEDPDDKMDVTWALIGQQADAAQAFGSALTYANRYFLLKFFQVATPDDDPDRWRNKKDEAEREVDMVMVKQIVTKIDAHVKKYVEGCENKNDARKQLGELVKQFVRTDKNVPTGDYNQLRDVDTANKLLQRLESDFPIVA